MIAKGISTKSFQRILYPFLTILATSFTLLAWAASAPSTAIAASASFLDKVQPLVVIVQRSQQALATAFQADALAVGNRADRTRLEEVHKALARELDTVEAAAGQVKVSPEGLAEDELTILTRALEAAVEVQELTREHIAAQKELVEASILTRMLGAQKFANAALKRRLTYTKGDIALKTLAAEMEPAHSVSLPLLLTDTAIARADFAMLTLLSDFQAGGGAVSPNDARLYQADFKAALEEAELARVEHVNRVDAMRRTGVAGLDGKKLGAWLDLQALSNAARVDALGIYARYGDALWSESGSMNGLNPAVTGALDKELAEVSKRVSELAIKSSDARNRLLVDNKAN